MKASVVLAACAFLPACGAIAPPASQWIGPLTASDPAHCPPTKGVLVLRATSVTFAPDNGVWVLPGTAQGNDIQAARTETQRNRSHATKLTAHRDGDTISGTYTTPTCTYRAELHLTER